MKRWLASVAFVLLICLCSLGTAFADIPGADSVPNPVSFIPAPPDKLATPYLSDFYYYQTGKTLRDTPRGEQARFDAECTPSKMLAIFSEVTGTIMSKEDTPAIYELVSGTMDTVFGSVKKAKLHYPRIRPYAEFKEPSLLPEKESSHHPDASYPSGHSAVGWAIALLMTELEQSMAGEILARGYDYGESRVIAGYHYKSDVDMARLIGSSTIVGLHQYPDFKKALEAAKKEYNAARAKARAQKNHHNDSAASPLNGARANQGRQVAR